MRRLGYCLLIMALLLQLYLEFFLVLSTSSDRFLKTPFAMNGWLLWAAIGLIGALIAIALTVCIMYMFGSGKIPKRKKDAVHQLLPFIGSSSVSTLWVMGMAGVLAPLLEETLFQGFFMVAMTKWVPTPVAVVISAAVFALCHRIPEVFPRQFVFGVALGFTHAKTRNLMAPITIHACRNSGTLVLLHWLQVQGYDIRKLLQANQKR